MLTRGDIPDPQDLPQPTLFSPGSAGKIAELRRRVEAGQQLWHPDDDDHVQCRRISSSRYSPVDYGVVRDGARLELRSRRERHRESLSQTRLMCDLKGTLPPVWVAGDWLWGPANG